MYNYVGIINCLRTNSLVPFPIALRNWFKAAYFQRMKQDVQGRGLETNLKQNTLNEIYMHASKQASGRNYKQNKVEKAICKYNLSRLMMLCLDSAAKTNI